MKAGVIIMSALDDASRRLQDAHARALGSLDAATNLASDAAAVSQAQVQGQRGRLVALARNKASQQVIQHSGAATDCARALRGIGSENVAQYLDLGTLTLDGAASGVNEPVVAPCLVPLLGRGNLVLSLAADGFLELTRHAVWNALSRTAPGQLEITCYDPKVSGVLAPFAGLSTASDRAFRLITRPQELEAAIDDATAEVQQIQAMLQGSSDTLLDYRASVGREVERFRLLILLDSPVGIDETAYRQLLALAKVGPAAGLSVVWHLDSGAQLPEWWSSRDLEAIGAVIRRHGNAYAWLQHPAFKLELPPSETTPLASRVNKLASAVSVAAAPAVDFSTVQDLTRRWTHSSADGVTFVVGLAGAAPVEITLGDERQQRHNALVTGAIGQGKSNLLKAIIHSLGQRYAPDELDLYLLDFKEGVTLYPFASTPESPDYLPHARVLGLESDRDFGLAVLHHIERQFAIRAKLFRPYGDDIAKYRAARPDEPMPRIVVIVDEFHLLFDPADKTAEEAAQVLEAIARRGRSYGVHLILASQSISGIAALLARENGIKAQFPIRIALKNSQEESFETLTRGNDGAARLRMRGEAIINLDYGSLPANQVAVIARANDADLIPLRQSWWEAARHTTSPPRVFDGSQRIRPSDAASAMRTLKARIGAEATAPAAIVGYPITVKDEPLTMAFGSEPGRNLAILGAGEAFGGLDEADEAANNAVGIIQAATLSLAFQHPAGDAEFICLDLLDPVTARRNFHDEWLRTMEGLGCPVRIVPKAQVSAFIKSLALDLPDRDPSHRTYLVGLGMDRAADLMTPDPISSISGADSLREVLRDGPGRGLHVLGSWTNLATFKNHIGYGNDGYIDCMVMLRLDQNAVQDLLGPFVAWSVRDNRGLAIDRTQLEVPTTIVPFSPLTPETASRLLSQVRSE